MCVSAKNSEERLLVQHDYHDHAFDQDPEESGDARRREQVNPRTVHIIEDEQDGIPVKTKKSKKKKTTDSRQQQRRGPRGGVAEPFPEKLHRMLSLIEADGLAHIVSWQPHGRCFLVRKPRDFVRDVMPIYFRQTKLTSFQRQLNLYGFCRLTTGVDRGGYYHELFLRGKPFLCKNMTRTRVKGTGIKAKSDPSSEPDFYAMHPISGGIQDGSGSSLNTEAAAPADQVRPNAIDSLVLLPSSDDLTNFEIPMLAPPSVISSSSDISEVANVVGMDLDVITASKILPPVTTKTSQPASPVPVTPDFFHRAMPCPPEFPTDLVLDNSEAAASPPHPPTPHPEEEVLFEGMMFHYLDSSKFECPTPAKFTRKVSMEVEDDKDEVMDAWCDSWGLRLYQDESNDDQLTWEEGALGDLITHDNKN